MNKVKKKHWIFRSFFLLPIVFVFFLPSTRLFAAGDGSALPLESAPTPTSTPEPLLLTRDESSVLEIFIQAPPGIVAKPYVILNAIELGSDSEWITVKGSFSDQKFTCESVPCMVPFPQSNNIRFYGYSDSGGGSEEVLAVVAVEEVESGYVVQIVSVSKYTSFADSCRATWGFQNEATPPAWAEFPQFYFELNTQRTLHYLAAKLIVSGIVDVSGCSNGGISADLTWPTGCGLVQAKDEVIEWQNQFDPYIWTASKDVGIPAKILKILIQTESQFWPANQRFYLDEYGLGQVTQLGLDVLLRDDHLLFQSFCPKVLEHCGTFYTNLTPENQALVRGALLSSLDASCPDCDNGFDITRAGKSVFYVARLLEADCKEVDSILYEFGTFEEAEYEDYWKFTLFTYHSGIVCFHSAVDATLKADQEMTWENLSENTNCVDGKRYVDGVWGELVSFDLYRYQADEITTDFTQPFFDAPPTPTPEPTQVPSSTEIQVQVLLEYLDGTTVPLNDIAVSVLLDDGTKLMKNTFDGLATFDMQGYPAQLDTFVSLPGLYRAERFMLPLRGVKEIVFVFAAPSLPPSLP